jgi:hypothetical protein
MLSFFIGFNRWITIGYTFFCTFAKTIIAMQDNKIYIDAEIDKITNSIEDSLSGEVFDTEVLPLPATDIAKADWRFDWHKDLIADLTAT